MTPQTRADERTIEAYPSRIGRYEVVSTLGVGGTARVYLALERGPNHVTKLFAIKRLRTEVVADAASTAVLADDARIALRLAHPNVVRTHEVVAEPPSLFVTMELLQGQSLGELLRRVGRDRMPLDLHLFVLSQVLAGLEYAHTLAEHGGRPLGVVHRDVSPSNVFVTYAGEVKLLDFGLSRVALANAEGAVGMLKNKLGYASPEQCMSRAVDSRSDLYSVGVLLWEALARRRRSPDGATEVLAPARVRDADLPIESVWPEVPAELASITHRALAWNPNDRFDSAAQMRRAIDRYLAGTGSPAAPSTLGPLISAVFRKELEKFRRTVDSHLGATRESEPAEASPSWRAPAGGRDGDDETRLFVRPTDLGVTPERAAAVSGILTTRPQSSRRRRLLFVASALFSALLAALWLLTR